MGNSSSRNSWLCPGGGQEAHEPRGAGGVADRETAQRPGRSAAEETWMVGGWPNAKEMDGISEFPGKIFPANSMFASFFMIMDETAS